MTAQTQTNNKSQTLESLYLLLSINRDGAEGYKAAAAAVENPHYKQVFTDYAEQRARFVTELTHMINKYGGVPDDSTSLLGELHQAWINLRDALSRGDSATLAECVRGEEAAIAIYQQELLKDLPTDAEALIRTQFVLLENAHERIQHLEETSK